VVAPLATALLTALPSLRTLVGAPDPSKVGDLAGNLPFAVYLLIPLALALAVVTALVLGASGEAATAHRRAGGVSRALRRSTADPRDEPTRPA
jgi:hypothetical protein